MHQRARIWVAAVAALCALVLVGCGSDGGENPAQPAPHGAGFINGEFNELPRYPGSSPLDELDAVDGSVIQSFSVPGATPDQIVAFYDPVLKKRGWRKLPQGPIKADAGAARGEWVRSGMLLIIAASVAPEIDDGSQTVSQYSLVLHTD